MPRISPDSVALTPYFNCYVGVIANDVIEARKNVLDIFHSDSGCLIHISLPEESDEGKTYIFQFNADVVNEDGDQDMLHDHFNLPLCINLPYELV